ncbi:ABC transporter permease [Faecalicatena contorta]|uniref:ABC transporter permease n=1 Tax=Faecalicatena contorta TaxID=39482 RepID=UPI001F231841|nr:hypothetical protein [Faecalicatena contorta]MCF2682885.1 hypothetical protein [Faecalicatena contorta]
MKKRLTADRIYYLITGVIIQVALIIPWIPLGGNFHNTYGYLTRLRRAEDMNVLVKVDMSAMGVDWVEWNDIQSVTIAFLVMLILMAVIQLLGLISLFRILLGRNSAFLPVVSLVVSCLGLLMSVEGPSLYMDNAYFKVYPVGIMFLLCIYLVGGRMLDSWTDASDEMQRIRERDRLAKKERKERLVFEGKYSPLFYRVIWKNFKSNWETYRVFILVATISISVVFAGVGIREMLSGMRSVENLAMGQGLGTVLMNFLIVAIVIAVFLVVSVLIFYLRHHVSSYALFQNLGIRSRTLYLFIGAELLTCIVFSLLGGYLFGNIVLFLCRSLITGGLEGKVVLEHVTVKSYLLTFLISFLLFLISAMATHDIYIEMGGSSSRYKAVQKEKMSGKWSPCFLIAGVGLLFYSIYGFSQREHAEKIGDIVLFLFGLYLSLRHGGNLYLCMQKKKIPVYYRNLLKNNYFYHYFKTAYRYLYLITLLHICVLFIFSREAASSLIAEKPETMFPYDYVCMATDDDRELFKELENNNLADVMTYPMVRVTNADNSTDINGTMESIMPQGQHIGISESTYQELCAQIGRKAKDLNLAEDGSEIYIIFQEDKSVKAHPIDYFSGKKTPYLHIGQPVVSYDYLHRADIFPPRTIVGMERRILIGNLRQGEYEDIVVFSDAYFEQIQELWKTTNYRNGEKIAQEEGVEGDNIHHWPDRLVLIHASDGRKSEIEEKLRVFEANHQFDLEFDSVVQAWYSKDQLADQLKAERFMNIAVSFFIMTLMAVVTLVLLYMKAESEMREKIRQQEFLQNMGMREKERLHMIRREVYVYFWIPMAVAAVSVMVFTGIMWRNRGYTPEDIMAYLKVLAVTGLFYVGIQLLGIQGISRYIIKKVERNYGNSH